MKERTSAPVAKPYGRTVKIARQAHRFYRVLVTTYDARPSLAGLASRETRTLPPSPGGSERSRSPATTCLDRLAQTPREPAVGQVSIKELTDNGDPFYTPLELIRLQPHEDKHGYRWYGFYRLTNDYGGGEVCVRLRQNLDDKKRRLNRAENVRPIPEGSKDFKRLHKLRPDAESINRGIEDALFIGRASAKGWRSQLVDLRGQARLINAISLARCQARGQPETP